MFKLNRGFNNWSKFQKLNSKPTFPMKKFIFLIFSVFAFSLSFGQKVYSVDHPYQADVKVYVVGNEYQADLIVYRTNKDYKAKSNENKGIWYFTDYPYRADKKIFFVEQSYQADIKIYFTDKEYRAGWKNNSKKHFMY